MQPDDSLIGQVVADRYRVLSRIGEGGMGRVYLAEHVRMGRKCALKVISPALATTAEAISRFNREAGNACRINHPNVAQVYDFGEMADGTLYLSMEYIEGDTLDAIIAREGGLPQPRAAQIAKQVADALYAAHHLGIVHRDLKPENVMVARHLDGSDWVKVVDFGIAKTVERDGSGSQTVTTAGVSLGTPEYMSPEQLAGERLDHRTDVYSLGLLLFHALTGELPYPRVTSKETLVRRLIARPRTLAEVRPKVAWPAALQGALDRALAPEVADRYTSVAEFGRDVVAAVAPAIAPAAAGDAAAPTLVNAPVPRPAPRHARLPNAHRVPSPMLRRALPWAIAAALVLFAATLFAARALHSRERLARILPRDATAARLAIATRDTTAARVAIVQQALPAATASMPASSTAASFTAASSRMAKTGPVPHDTTPSHVPTKQSAMLDHAPARPASRDSLGVHRTTPAAKPAPAPSGDTAHRPVAADTSAASRSAIAAREIRSHIDRMKEHFAAGDPRGARQELGEAASELSIMRDLDASSEEVMALQRELAQGVRDLIASCYRMRSDSTLPRGIRCENLAPAAGRFRQNRRRDP